MGYTGQLMLYSQTDPLKKHTIPLHGTPKHLRFNRPKALQFHFFAYIRNNIKDELSNLNAVLILLTVV